MNALDPARIARLARTLNAQPRHALVAALRLARLSEAGATDTGACRKIIEDARAGGHAAESVAALLATPVASHAQDDVEHALASLWPASG